MIAIGRMDKRVALQNVTRVPTPDGETETWGTYASIDAAIEPTTAAQVERSIASTVQTPISHLVTIWYRERRATATAAPGADGKISVADRVLWNDRGLVRALHIGGIQDPQEEHRQLVLACEERAA